MPRFRHAIRQLDVYPRISNEWRYLAHLREIVPTRPQVRREFCGRQKPVVGKLSDELPMEHPWSLRLQNEPRLCVNRTEQFT
jgi:hypothetical protein